MIRISRALGQLALVLVIAACGSSNNNSTNASVRFVNATVSTSLTVTLNNNTQFSGVPESSASSYASVTAGTYTVTVTGPNGTPTSSTQQLALASAQTYSLLAYVRDGALYTALVTESEGAPASGYGVFGLANLSPDSGPLDVYVVTPGASIIGLTPTFQDIQNGAAAVSSTFAAGNYDIVATAVGTPTDVRFKAPSLAIVSGQIVSLALTSTPGGALLNGAFLIQSGSVRFVAATNARVRAVSALPASPPTPVVATVGGTVLATVFSPIAGTYTLVPGGTSTYSITANGTAVAGLPAATFATGGDYTILVYGAAASPVVAVLTDNNQVPIGGEVNLRLVNAGVNNGASGLTLYDNGVQVASSIQYGMASNYFGVTVASNTTFELIAPGNTPAMLVVPNESLPTPLTVYTVFVIDTSLTPYLIRDR